MKNVCFAEYRIAAENRASYLSYTGRLIRDGELNIYLYEGTDQPNLFVEIWYADSEDEAEQIKKERCSERSPWYRVAEWVVGGADKLHVWTFKPAALQKSAADEGSD
ncbi:hypothetical protein [Paenibacillus sp. NEAU-GSW1]|uniref:hypothetical protein n=1 Tax=Paenibacillus sp. NEAU-GSW1 TaxID=2682486 RepID=UPI0012E2653D|nr:hypothetical protein [Paenibacillus sp. NEAU-GSW1]MUT67568.1 hypothetical protein [Paenibacillus sp. NEAU-GSW1]